MLNYLKIVLKDIEIFLNKIWNSNKFSLLNNCKYDKKFKVKQINLDVNKWIYFELLKTNYAAKKHIKNFRFDEAAKVIYQFVWHFYCDWYIEFLKAVFDTKDKKNLKETRAFSAYVQSCILIMLHPFIPFFTEKVWLDLDLNINLKTPLMYKDWELPIKSNLKFKKSYKKIDWLIQLITNIRSAKVDLDITPDLYIDISIEALKTDKKDIINNNLSLFKRLGRVSNIHNFTVSKNAITIIVGLDTVALYFDKDVNLSEQKLKVLNKVKFLDSKVIGLMKKLDNKSFLKNAPKTIVQKEKNSLIQYNSELKKLNSILNSIKN